MGNRSRSSRGRNSSYIRIDRTPKRHDATNSWHLQEVQCSRYEHPRDVRGFEANVLSRKYHPSRTRVALPSSSPTECTVSNIRKTLGAIPAILGTIRDPCHAEDHSDATSLSRKGQPQERDFSARGCDKHSGPQPRASTRPKTSALWKVGRDRVVEAFARRVGIALPRAPRWLQLTFLFVRENQT